MSKKKKIIEQIGAWELRQNKDGKYRWTDGRSVWNPVEKRWAKDAPWGDSPETASAGLEELLAKRREKEGRELSQLQNELYRIKDGQ